MQYGVIEQIKFILIIFLSGMFCGLVYDMIRARRKLLDLGDIYVNIEDTIFCIFSGIVFLAVTFYLNSGVIRISGFFGIIFGEFLYFLLIRNKIRNFFIFLAKKINELLILIIKITLFPVKLFDRLLRRPVHIAVWYVGGRLRKVKYKFKSSGEKLKKHIKLISIFTRKRAKKH